MDKGNMQILVADDDPMSLKIVKSLLAKWEYEVMTVQDGKAAFDILSDHRGPKMAVLDWMMPEIDGLEVCKKVKKINPAIYTILLTSVEESDAISTALMICAIT